MSEEPVYSAAPNRYTTVDGQGEIPPQSWEPPPQTMSRMRMVVHGEVRPWVDLEPEEDEADPGTQQKQADEDAYRRLLTRSAERSRADYAGQKEDAKLNAKMRKMRGLRNDTERDYLSPLELEPVRPRRRTSA